MRPDALLAKNSSDLYRSHSEVDTRSGSVLDEAPELQFLDAYQIQLTPLRALSASLGVFEQLSSGVEAYESDIGFGLEVMPVKRTSGLWLRWLPEVRNEGKVSLDLVVFQGPGERSEYQNPGDNMDDDQTNRSKDKRNGGMIATSYDVSDSYSLSGAATFFESRVSDRLDFSRMFFHLGAKSNFSFKSLKFLVAGDARYGMDRFDEKKTIGSDVTSPPALKDTYAPRTHTSLKLSGMMEVVPEFFLISSFQLGQATLDSVLLGQVNPPDGVVPTSGHQMEWGLKTGGAQGVEAQLTFAQEKRLSEDAQGGKSGGFKQSTGVYRETLQRVAFNVTYFFDTRL